MTSVKIVFAILSVVVAIISFFPYIRDVLAKRTTPHIYSWLIWSILQITAMIAILRENSLWSALGVGIVGFISILVVLLSFRYGTKNITSFDTLCLVGAVVAIGVWIFAHDVLVSMVLVTIIDFVAFLPTYRKGYEEPYSETVVLYFCSAIACLFSLLSLTHYSIESSLYVGSLIVTNTIFITIILVRRRVLNV